MLTAKYRSVYRKEGDATVRFTYIVSGNPEDLKKYSEAQGDYLRLDDDTGKPLYFTKKYVSDDIQLIITKEGKVITDDSDIAKMQSLIQQYGPDVARLIMAKSSPSPVSPE